MLTAILKVLIAPTVITGLLELIGLPMKIANWSEYNKALASRGNISILISEDIIKDGHIVPPSKANQVGKQSTIESAIKRTARP